ncbi:U3 small nucleolar RNA-associated protein [Arthrobotrys musiformis]|uniref:U3 small nucleolar RNA-associated protein n=1 Tax=Arthrobotrys musiformis TaxID=47236 RepID=A0AAV9WSJ5_9PEZI
MDIHRCRFVDYIPSQIHAVAFSHPSEYNPQAHHLPPSLRLAIGRSNGSIEIWNPTNWFHESTLHGGVNRSIEGLAWIRQSHYTVRHTELLRLFSIGNSTVVTEWDLVTGKPLAHFDCGKGIIWSIAAQPKKSWFKDRSQPNSKPGEEAAQEAEDPEDGAYLAVGCEDGSLVIISVGDSPGSLSLSKIIPQSKACRVLSLAWQSPTTVIAGTSDSKLRAFDTVTGRTITTMSVAPKFNNKRRNAKKRDAYVWSVKYIPSNGGWIVAGDSLGEISVYDGKRYTLRQKLKSHDADVLTLETNSNGTQFFSSGVDKVTVKHELVGLGKRATWTQVVKKRFHKHDVRAMGGFEAGAFSVLVTGGVDMTPVVVPLRKFAEEYQYTLSALPQEQLVATTVGKADSRLLVARFDREVKIWRVNSIDEVEAADDVELYGAVDEDQGRKFVGGIQINADENISSAAVSPNGDLLAISTMATLKLFHLRPRKTTVLLRISKLELPERIATIGARRVIFSPDGKYLAFFAPNSEPYIFKITASVDEDGNTAFDFGNLQHLDRKDREVSVPGNKLQRKDGVIALGRGYERQISRACFSPNGKYLFSADVGGWMEAWSLEDAKKGKWKLIKSSLPRLPASPVAVGFRPQITPESGKPDGDSSEVFVMTADHTLHEFDVVTGQVTAWSSRNSDRLPREFLKLKDRCFGISVVEEKGKGRRMWCWGHGWVFMINVDRDLNTVGAKKSKTDEAETKGLKRKRGLVLVSGAGGEAINARKDMVRGTEVTLVGKAAAAEEDEGPMDVESDEEFLVDKVRNNVRKKGDVEMVHSESEDDSSEEEDDDDDDDSSDDSSDDSESEKDSDEGDKESESELSATEHPDEEDGGVKLDVEMEIDSGAQAAPAGVVVQKKTGLGVPHWHTFQYRNVMAFLPIGDPKEDLEMVVVERPVSDVKLPPAWMPKKDASRARAQKFV